MTHMQYDFWTCCVAAILQAFRISITVMVLVSISSFDIDDIFYKHEYVSKYGPFAISSKNIPI